MAQRIYMKSQWPRLPVKMMGLFIQGCCLCPASKLLMGEQPMPQAQFTFFLRLLFIIQKIWYNLIK